MSSLRRQDYGELNTRADQIISLRALVIIGLFLLQLLQVIDVAFERL